MTVKAIKYRALRGKTKMRILGWMNHKLRQSSVEPFKEFKKGNYCTCLTAQSPIDDQVTQEKTNLGTRYGSGLLKQSNEECQNTFCETGAKVADKNYSNETSNVMSEIFDGFLAIGTLGSEPNISEPATPTFPMSLEYITDEKEEVTQCDLKLINEELEKFFEAEAEEENCKESLGRSSYVTTITLSGMQNEGIYAEDYGKTEVCPLQGYLFGSSIGMSNKSTEATKEKASLGELFQRTKIIDENSTENKEKGEMQAKREQKSAKYLIKKILKMFHASPGNPIYSSGDESSFSTKKKINKVLKMFHRKVHPEQSIVEKESAKSHKEKKMGPLHCDDYYTEPVHQDNDKNIKFPLGSKPVKGIDCCPENKKIRQYGFSGNRSSNNKEYWIKTDSEYLVLEL